MLPGKYPCMLNRPFVLISVNLGTKSKWFRNSDEALLPFEIEKDTNITMTVDGKVSGDGCTINDLPEYSFNIKAGTVR